MAARVSQDCFCADGATPWCPPCVVAVATRLCYDHPNSLSIALLKRRIPGITGHEAALLLEFTKYLPAVSPAHQANRDSRRYVV